MDPESFRRVMSSLGRATACGLLVAVLLWDLSIRPAGSTVVVTTSDNSTFPFVDAEAAFGAEIPYEGITGKLVEGVPTDGCQPLQLPDNFTSVDPWIALIMRGNCVFETKIMHAQQAGAIAAIVFNNENNRELVTMAVSGRADYIKIAAVFVDNRSGRVLQYLTSQPGASVTILPNDDTAAWSMLAITFISLMCVSAIFATFFLVRHNRALSARFPFLADPTAAMTASEVKALPAISFKSGTLPEDVDTCAICLEDYTDGDTLRLLPCRHEFHSACVDPWLMSRRPFCPVCKRDASQPSLPIVSSPLLSNSAAAEQQPPSSAATSGGAPSQGLRNNSTPPPPSFASQPSSSSSASSSSSPPHSTDHSAAPLTTSLAGADSNDSSVAAAADDSNNEGQGLESGGVSTALLGSRSRGKVATQRANREVGGGNFSPTPSSPSPRSRQLASSPSSSEPTARTRLLDP